MRATPLRFAATLAAALAALALGAAGCGGPPAPAAPDDLPGYRQLRERFGPRDFQPLMGRSIVLDPGHGGWFRGAIGPNGLAEADVNLGVALQLRGLLEWAGARVALTRTADYDFLTPADSSLATDLAFRSSFTDSIQPDVFISLHHNSTAAADPTVNETQTYYPLGDDGASADLARAIHRHLVLNLEISPARILPGNFHVLRHATVPAVLGEPAMISHPVMAGRLSLAAAQRLEAEAYFLGLLDYFGAGDPQWRPAQADTLRVPDQGTMLAWTMTDGGAGAPAPDPASFRVSVDGRPAAAAIGPDGATIRWWCPPPRDGLPRRVQVDGANLRGRRARSRATVLLPAAAERVVVTAVSDPAAADPRRAALVCRGADGRPLPPGAFGWPDAGAGGLLAWDGAATAAGVVTRGDAAPIFVGDGPAAPLVELAASVLGDSLRVKPVAGPPADWLDRLGDLPPLAGGSIIRPGRPHWHEAAGYHPLAAAAADAAPDSAVPLLPVMAGLTIVIDPAGGADDADGTGPLGLRGADINLGVAQRLAGLADGCGARSVLSRGEADIPTPIAKIRLAEREHADLFLTVGRSSGGGITVLHHPGSAAGQAWAEAAAAALARLLPDTPCTIAPSWGYLLRHTACPALEVRLPGPVDAAAELRQDQPAWQAAEARALLLALAAHRNGGPVAVAALPDLILQLPGAPAPASVTWARWDGNLAWYPLPRPAGPDAAAAVPSWREPGLPAAGAGHHLEIHTAQGWQLWNLTRDQDDRWSGCLLLSGPTGTPHP